MRILIPSLMKTMLPPTADVLLTSASLFNRVVILLTSWRWNYTKLVLSCGSDRNAWTNPQWFLFESLSNTECTRTHNLLYSSFLTFCLSSSLFIFLFICLLFTPYFPPFFLNAVSRRRQCCVLWSMSLKITELWVDVMIDFYIHWNVKVSETHMLTC